MEKLKKCEAFDRAVVAFGKWSTWSRWEHIAYGLIRGVPYAAMECYANDCPDLWTITRCLMKLGAWPEPQPEETPRSWWERLWGKKVAAANVSYDLVRKHVDEVQALVVWVRKPIRVKKVRPERAETVAAPDV